MKEFYSFSSNAAGDVATISLYDVVGFYGSQARDFQRLLSEIKAKKIQLRINSPGGSVFDGYTIYQLLKSHPARVEVHIDGAAASIAATIAMAGDVVIMPQNSMLMVHMPLADMGMANANELRQGAEVLDKLTQGIIGIFVNRTGQNAETVNAWLAKDNGGGTWFTADEALDLGLADKVTGRGDFSSKFDIKAFACCERLTDTFKNISPAAPDIKPETKPESTMTPEQIAAMQAENIQLKQFQASVDTMKQTAANDALNVYKAQETKRRTDIKAYADKYNQPGDLNDLVATALASDMTFEAFKDGVTEVIAKRTTKPAIKPGAQAKPNGEEDKSDGLSDFVTAYNATTPGSAARRNLIRERKAEARSAFKTGRISE